LIPFALTLIVENLFILPLSLALAETGKNLDRRFLIALFHSIIKLSRNPIIIAIILGLVCSALSVSLPSLAQSTIKSLAATVAGLAQFTIGGILAGVAITAISRGMSLVIMGKLLIHPAAILAMILILPPLGPMFSSIAIILACMPMFSIYAVLALDYNLEEFCSAVLLPTTILSFITINLAIWITSIKYGLH
ncbi:MAG: AEC family transporter, partial [Sinobacterium sp.]